MNFVFAFESSLWDQLVQALDRDTETAGVIVARRGLTEQTLTLLGRRIRWVPEADYAIRTSDRLEIKSSGYVPALGAAADEHSIAVFFHTHPRGDAAPSTLDDKVDAQLQAVFQQRTRQPHYASLILGGTSARPEFSGRIYEAGSQDPLPLSRIRVSGSRLLLLTASGGDETASPQFDRQVRAFGKDGQAVLSRMRIGVVGVGGTGSAVCEQLIRLGVGQLTVIDDDLIDATNVSRVHETTQSDVGTAKVDFVARRAHEIRPHISVQPIRARLNSPAVCRFLLDCDLVFGCTDDVYGRSVLSRLAYWYLLPVIDMGFVIDVRAGAVHGLFGRVTVLEPGAACLICRGRLTSQAIAVEAMSPGERTARAGEGYAPGLNEPDPSVVTYTTLVGSLAVSEMLARLFRIGTTHPTEMVVRLADRTISRNSTPAKLGHWCVDHDRWGSGDEEPMLSQLWPS